MTIPTIDQTIDRLRAFAAVKKWRPSRFAIEAGLSKNSLRDFNEPGWNPNRETVSRLEALVPPDFTADQAANESANLREGEAA